MSVQSHCPKSLSLMRVRIAFMLLRLYSFLAVYRKQLLGSDKMTFLPFWSSKVVPLFAHRYERRRFPIISLQNYLAILNFTATGEQSSQKFGPAQAVFRFHLVRDGRESRSPPPPTPPQPNVQPDSLFMKSSLCHHFSFFFLDSFC